MGYGLYRNDDITNWEEIQKGNEICAIESSILPIVRKLKQYGDSEKRDVNPSCNV